MDTVILIALVSVALVIPTLFKEHRHVWNVSVGFTPTTRFIHADGEIVITDVKFTTVTVMDPEMVAKLNELTPDERKFIEQYVTERMAKQFEEMMYGNLHKH